MKPTDLWGGFPKSLRLHPRCHNGDSCHVAAPRGSQTGTQGRKSIANAIRSEDGVYAYGGFIPYALSRAVLDAIEKRRVNFTDEELQEQRSRRRVRSSCPRATAVVRLDGWCGIAHRAALYP